MQNKLQELTEKIYNEGVSKANSEADEIIKKAQQQADEIIKNAKAEEKSILEQAQKQSEEIEHNIQSEIKLVARQAINSVKQQVTDLILAKMVDEPVKKSFDDIEFVKEMMKTAVANWDPRKTENFDISLLIPKAHEIEMNEYFDTKAKELLDAGLEVIYDERSKSGFKIGPKDGSYKISFSDEDFISFFNKLLRPKTITLLYQEDNQ